MKLFYGDDIVRHSEKSEQTVKHNLPGRVRLPAPQPARVAQLVEHRIHKPAVVGSIPTPGTNFFVKTVGH